MPDTIISAIGGIIALVALVVAIYTYVITRKHLIIDRMHKFSERLLDTDRLLIGQPSIARIMYNEANRQTRFFHAGADHNDDYFMLKSFIYLQLNCFDEFVSILRSDATLRSMLEFDAWANYIVVKMRHPLLREIYATEKDIWGTRFREFVAVEKGLLPFRFNG
jgi:hypothetical protein